MKTQEHSKLQEFLIEQLKTIYWAEKKMVEALPALHKAATLAKLKEVLTIYLEEKKNHVIRLEHAFARVDEPPAVRKCHAITGILTEGNQIMDDTQEGTAQRDMGIIFIAKKLAHYGMATYSALLTLTETLNYEHMDEVLNENFIESEKMDSSLTALARNDFHAAKKESKT